MTDTNNPTIDENDLVLVTSAAAITMIEMGDKDLAEAMRRITGTIVTAADAGTSVTITPDSEALTPNNAKLYILMFERIANARAQAAMVSNDNNDEGEIVYV